MSHCTRPVFRDNKPRWYALHRKSIYKMIRQQARVAILGDSIVEGLARYPAVWNDHLKPFNTVNCGIGGDSIQHLLWRVGHLSIPQSLRVAVLLCGTNNMQGDKPQDMRDMRGSHCLWFKAAGEGFETACYCYWHSAM